MPSQRAWTQPKLAIEVDQNRCVLRRHAPFGRDRAHVIGVTSNENLWVQPLYFVNIIIGHWMTIIETENGSSNRTNHADVGRAGILVPSSKGINILDSSTNDSYRLLCVERQRRG